MRGLADRVLVLTPAGLVEQWREELERKFALPTAIATARWGPGADGGGDRRSLLASLAAARREPLRSALAGATGTWWSWTRRTGCVARAARPASSFVPCAAGTCSCSPPPRWRTGCRTSTSWSAWWRPACSAPPPSSAQVRTAGGGVAAAQRGGAAAPDPPGDGPPPAQRGGPAAAPTARRDRARHPGRRRAGRSTPSWLHRIRAAGQRRHTGAHHGPAQLSPGWPAPARRRPRPRWPSSAGPTWPSRRRRSQRPAQGAGCWCGGCTATSSAARRCWCSPRSARPSTRLPPGARRRASPPPPTTAASPGAEKDGAIGGLRRRRPGAAVHRVRRARAATCSSAT